MRKKISEELKGKMCSMAVDGCSRNQRHFIGINVQYELNGEKVVRTLAVEELFVSSTAANLKHIISMRKRNGRVAAGFISACKLRMRSRLCVAPPPSPPPRAISGRDATSGGLGTSVSDAPLTRNTLFDIPIKSIVSFTTDSGANYILAGKLLNEENLEFDYDIDYDLPEDIQMIQGEFSIQSVRCAAHTLQLAVEDAVKPRVGSESLKPLLIAVRKLANFLRNPSNVLQIKEENLPLPSLDCVTRWGSTYDMVASVFKLRNFLDRKFTFNSAKEKAENSLTGTQCCGRAPRRPPTCSQGYN
ncbi:LOW QUALITY PROTEIN: Zinc finger BED domain-containing protein RICESLEEPER 2 [Frankliniella fusca]|uniref:Zinc finger BED domain-containing protein RICESLEEPER 2 n=1 Tax=Frankliniella fusca TaxID=407009 RepID=A0AAE1HPS0_9NEOP|nr:LOW QUALITY PROTEIN: Zinc finger BED domain-containing protein RICESLEEPER 2 [Frankliniella fusca]